MTIEHELNSLNEFLNYLTEQKLAIYPKDPYKAISFGKSKAELELHCGSTENGKNIYSSYNKFLQGIPAISNETELALINENLVDRPYIFGGLRQLYFHKSIEVGSIEMKVLLGTEFEGKQISNSIISEKYFLTIDIKMYDSEKIASIFDPKKNFLRKQIDSGNYCSIKKFLLFNRNDLFMTAQNDFFMLVGRFTHNGNDYIVVPSIKHHYRILKVPPYKQGDIHYNAGETYKATLNCLISTECGDW